MKQIDGIITAAVGGLYTVRCDDGEVLRCPARGVFRHQGVTPLVGDRVTVEYDPASLAEKRVAEKSTAATRGSASDGFIAAVHPRRSELVRPPVANIDLLYITAAAAKPDPQPISIDKMTCVAEHNGIEPVIIVTKRDLAPERADELAAIYRLAGYTAFAVSVTEGSGDIDALHNFVKNDGAGKISAFAGVSGAGKSTVLGHIYPHFTPEVGEVSRKLGRGRHTTRTVTLYEIEGGGYIADTPGFSLLDFIRYDFMEVDDLAYAFREFQPYLGRCRYNDCSHTKEEGCVIIEAIEEGKVARTRHESYVTLYAELKSKKPWK